MAIAGTVLAPGVASASPGSECQQTDPRTGVCLVWVQSPGVDASASGGDAVIGSPVVDTNPCTYQLAQPQPATTSPVWAGQKPEDGAIWMLICPKPLGLGTDDWIAMVFVPNGAAPAEAAPVDPRQLAQQAIASMVMRAPEIEIAPPPESVSALVGVPIWLWTQRSEDVTGPTQASASAGAVTVTAVGRVSAVVWDMGDGHVVTCGLGTPYRRGTSGASPDCGYVYEKASTRHRADAAWPITATSTWTITWTGGGQSGVETLQLSSTAELVVGEMQVLNQNGSTQ
jgi:hypothetical protein